MKLSPFYVEKPWGRNDLPAVFDQAAGRQIGEIWFDAPAISLPILVKWLFTSEKLSVQVHPNDDQAVARGMVSGKEECWVIISAEPGARLGIGTLIPLTAEELHAAAVSGEIEQLLDWKPVKAGDYFYIPAGTVHAIGGGVSLVEVQQNADITYRLYDYGRPRELHLDDGVAVSRAQPYTDTRCGQLSADASQLLVDGPHFTLWHARGDAVAELTHGKNAVWVIPLAAAVYCGEESAAAGECLYLQSCEVLRADIGVEALICWIKELPK